MKKQAIYMIIENNGTSFETTDKKCVEFYEKQGAKIIKKGSYKTTPTNRF